ncbi:hypothetical protein [Streptomyces spiralis]|uniref:hypothetical protein n=1 Tax=Streptomyces spiralis TaxID=66376 RepID=UPI0036C49085
MTAQVVIYPPTESGGRPVRVNGEVLGTAYRLLDVAELLRRAGILDDEDVVYVGGSQLIEWRGGGPDVWEH